MISQYATRLAFQHPKLLAKAMTEVKAMMVADAIKVTTMSASGIKKRKMKHRTMQVLYRHRMVKQMRALGIVVRLGPNSPEAEAMRGEPRP